MTSAFAGTAPLLRASLRHDLHKFLPFIAFATLLSASSVVAYPLIFPDASSRAALAGAIGSNPALGLIFGPAHDLSTVDGFNEWRSLALGGFLSGLGTILLVTGATRAQEDSGQAELLASGVMARATRLLSAVVMAFIGSVVLGLVASVVTIILGGGVGPSFLLGMTFTATGVLFATVAALTAQIGADARTANSMAIGLLGVLFVARGFLSSVGAPDWTNWLNPLAWIGATRPATDANAWPLVPVGIVALVLLVLAFVLQARRDFGQGAIAPRPGPVRGRERTTWRLALQLNRGQVLIWVIAFIGLGVIFGYFARSLPDVLRSNRAVQTVFAAGAATPGLLIAAFMTTILSLVGILAAIPGVQTVTRVRSEEMADRVEPIIATAVSRPRYYASNVVLALVTSATYLLIAGGLIAFLASSANIGVNLPDALLQAVVTVPAVWAVVGVAVAVIGARPRVALAAWIGVLLSFVLTVLGPTFHLWDWILAISPFWHVPRIAGGSPDWSGLVLISVVALALMAVGFAGFRRRDLATS